MELRFNISQSEKHPYIRAILAIFRYYTPIGGVEGPNGYPINRPIQSDSKNTLGTILEVCISKRLTDIPKDTQLLRALLAFKYLNLRFQNL